MNKLIIIGNGFDLAHGLKTSYGDFLKAHLLKNIEAALDNTHNSDRRIFKVNFLRAYPESRNVNVFSNANDVFELYLSKPSSFSSGILLGLKAGGNMINHFYKVTISSNSNLVERLMHADTSLLWVDIERIFYGELKSILNNANLLQNEVIEKLRILNNELNILKEVLLEHLEEETKHAEINDYFEEIAEEEIDSKHILERDFVNASFFENKTLDFKKIIFLDFNYTSLIRKCKVTRFQSEYLPIHGLIKSSKHPVIFGYGDEIDEIYQEIEKTNINEYMTHIKSFGYFKTNIYSDLKRMIDTSPFVVYIWGHSCGLSDRTLLNMIFENDNCVGIKIFYYEKDKMNDNFDEITQNISRHFKNKMKMRNRVFNKTLSEVFPQMTQ